MMYPLPEKSPEPSATPLQPPCFVGFEKPMSSPTNYTFSNPPIYSHDMNPHSPTPWSTGLCSCCTDINSCCLTCWCPCVAFGRIAEIVDRGSTTCGVSGAIYMAILGLTGSPCLHSCIYRSKLRAQYFVNETPCSDCCVHCCCEECALCQEYRHLQNQGFDLSIGWHGNVERQKRVAKMFPMAVEAMSKN